LISSAVVLVGILGLATLHFMVRRVTRGRALPRLRLGHGIGAAGAEVSTESLTLAMPAYFGKALWTVPLSEITVVDAGPRQVDSSGLTIPRFYATPGWARGGLTLLFRTPQRGPVLRRLGGIRSGLSARASRAAGGSWVDGMKLGFRRRAQAQAALSEAGVPSTPSIATWAREQRSVARDAAPEPENPPRGLRA
jgi:hypothetical protein